MSFGFSVGDFIGALNLAIDLSKALSETRGVSVELQRLSARLDSLQKAINNAIQAANEWDLAHPNAVNKDPLNALVEEHNICKRLLEDFWKGSRKYTESIINGKGAKVKREWAKIKWCMFHGDDAVALERNLGMHVMAINMYSCELRCRILKDIASLNSSELAVVRRNINRNTLTLQDVSVSVRRFERLLKSIQDSIIGYTVQRPSAAFFPPDAPITLLDALGRELAVPIYLTGTFDIFHGFLELIYKSQPGHDKILRQEYRLADEDSDGALITKENWNKVAKPGKSISLSMVLRKSAVKERVCPRCNIPCSGPMLFGQRLRCPSCQITFQVFSEERVIELPEKPPLQSRIPTTKRAQTPSPGPVSPSNIAKAKVAPKVQDRSLRYEDVFRRIHIVREIIQIKGRYRSTDRDSYYSPPEPAIKYEGSLVDAVKNADVNSLKAALDIDKRPDQSYLIVAAWNQLPLPVFELLIASGEDIHTPDDHDLTPLHVTCQWSAEISAFLIANGADPTASSDAQITPLHYAESPEVARQLISLGADVNGIDSCRWTPLMSACNNRDREEVARVLIESGGEVEATSDDGRTLLHLAWTEATTRLLLEFGADPNRLDSDNKTPLHYSRCGGRARVLIELGLDVNAISADGKTPLHMAWFPDVAKVLLENGADIQATDNSGCTPLHTCSDHFPDSGITRVLVENGAEVNARDGKGRTPLHMIEDPEVAEVLLENGADVNAIDMSGCTPLNAIGHRHLIWAESVVEVLLQNGADVNAKDSDGRTLLHMAWFSHIAKVLLDNGADINAIDVSGCTPLHTSARSKDADRRDGVCRVLLENGADVSARDLDGRTPLHMAWSPDVAKVLLENGADVNAIDVSGCTPLHTSARSQDAVWRDGVCRVLLENGADVSARDLDGRTPLHGATKKCRAVLLKYGADVQDLGDLEEEEEDEWLG